MISVGPLSISMLNSETIRSGIFPYSFFCTFDIREACRRPTLLVCVIHYLTFCQGRLFSLLYIWYSFTIIPPIQCRRFFQLFGTWFFIILYIYTVPFTRLFIHCSYLIVAFRSVMCNNNSFYCFVEVFPCSRGGPRFRVPILFLNLLN